MSTRQTRVPTRGWHAVVEHPDGHELTPSVADDASINPTVNGLPRVDIPIKKDAKWSDSAFEDQPLRVWRDGERLPIDTLETVDQTEGDGQAQTVLRGRGGTELDQRVQVEYDSKPIPAAARELIDEHTSYVPIVDAPETTTRQDVEVLTADTETELQNALLNPIDDTDPVAIRNGRLELLQSCHLREAENVTYSGNYTKAGATSGGGSIVLSSVGDRVETTIATEYDIPDGEVGVAVRVGNPNGASDMHGLSVQLDGVEVFGATQGWSVSGDWIWFDSYQSINGLAAGSHTVTVECDSTATNDVYVDLVTLRDDRFDYDFPNTLGSGDTLAGPQKYPDEWSVAFEDVEVIDSVVGGAIESTWTATAGNQALALSNDRGQSYQSVATTDSFSTTFGTPGPTLRAKVTLSRHGTAGAQTPRRGYKATHLEDIRLTADLDETPLVISQSYDESLEDILADLADKGDYIWEFRRGPVEISQTTGGAVVGEAVVGSAVVGSSQPDAQSGQEAVVWTSPGQRVTDRTVAESSYSVSKTTEPVAQQVTVRGQSVPVRNERFTARVGEAVELANDRLLEERATIRDPRTGKTLVAGEDYRIQPTPGTITATSGGAMADGDVYEASYEYKTSGTYTVADAPADPESRTFDIPALTTDRGCGQAARIIARNIDEPLYEAELTIPSAAGFSVVQSIRLPDLPGSKDEFEIRSVTNTPAETVLSLESRDQVGDLIGRISSRVSAISKKV